MTGARAALRRHTLCAHFGLAMALSWLVELPLVPAVHGQAVVPVPYSLHYLAAFGPLLAVGRGCATCSEV